MRSITAATLILFVLFVGCRGGLLGAKDSLSYAQYRSLRQGTSADAVISAFGKPSNILERSGKIRGLTYLCENARGVAVPLRMVFDERGRLTKWVLQRGA